MQDDLHLNDWKQHLAAIKLRLLHPASLTLDERARLQFELREIERLVRDQSLQTPG